MYVYKITDVDENSYMGGGMALVAATNKEEAVRIFRDISNYDTTIHYSIRRPYNNKVKVELLKNLVWCSPKQKVITENWYYE